MYAAGPFGVATAFFRGTQIAMLIGSAFSILPFLLSDDMAGKYALNLATEGSGVPVACRYIRLLPRFTVLRLVSRLAVVKVVACSGINRSYRVCRRY